MKVESTKLCKRRVGQLGVTATSPWQPLVEGEVPSPHDGGVPVVLRLLQRWKLVPQSGVKSCLEFSLNIQELFELIWQN